MSCRAENTMRGWDNVLIRNRHRDIHVVNVLGDYRTVP